MSDLPKPGETFTTETPKYRASMTVTLGRAELDQAVREYLSLRLVRRDPTGKSPFHGLFGNSPVIAEIEWPADVFAVAKIKERE